MKLITKVRRKSVQDVSHTWKPKHNKDLTLSSDADAVGVVVGTQRPIMHHSVHGHHGARLLGPTVETTALVLCTQTHTNTHTQLRSERFKVEYLKTIIKRPGETPDFSQMMLS